MPKNPPQPDLSPDAIRAWRLGVGASQIGVAAAVGCAATTVWAWEHGVLVPSPEHAAALRRLIADPAPALAARGRYGRLNPAAVPDLRERFAGADPPRADRTAAALGVHRETLRRALRGINHAGAGGPVVVPAPGGVRGAAHPKAKLADAEVRAIRGRYAAGGVTMDALAAEYGVSQPAVWAVVHRRVRRETG